MKKFPRSLSRSLEILRYNRVKNKHGGPMERANVGFLTIQIVIGLTNSESVQNVNYTRYQHWDTHWYVFTDVGKS